MQYKFTSVQDRDACRAYCTDTVTARKAQPTIEYMTMLVTLQPNSSSDSLREFWDAFLSIIASSYKSKTIDDLKSDYPWGVTKEFEMQFTN